MVVATELGLDPNKQQLQEVNRNPGENNVCKHKSKCWLQVGCIFLSKIGMVVWRMKMLTPQYPQGREIIVISNDITHQIGSFGPKEDLLFKVLFIVRH